MKIEELFDVADTYGWSVYEDETEWDIRKPSPAGEDFGFYIHKSEAEDADGFAREVRRFADEFDPDENVEMWVEAKRNGGKGIPDVRTLVQDADDIQEMLDNLADALTEAVSESAGTMRVFDIGFINPETGLEDETELDAEDENEARRLFEKDFCDDNGWEGTPDILYIECVGEDNAAERKDEPELNAEQIARLDAIDNAMYVFLKTLLEKDGQQFPWSMEYIGTAVDLVADFMYERGFDIHRPAIVWDEGVCYISDGEYHNGKGATKND